MSSEKKVRPVSRFAPEDVEVDKSDYTTLQTGASVVIALTRIYTYLDELSRQLSQASNRVMVDLPIHEYGVYQSLEQKDYQLSQISGADQPRVAFSFHLVSDRALKVEYYFDDEEARVIPRLKEDGVRILSSQITGAGSEHQKITFELAGDIPVQLQFEGDLVKDEITLSLTNFESLGVQSYLIHPNRVSDDFLKQLGRLLLRKRSSFLKETEVLSDPSRTSPREYETVTMVEPQSADILEFEVSRLLSRKRVILRYQRQEHHFDVDDPVCYLGRKFPADIQIRSRFVSREHASVIYQDSGFIIRDNSSNGTFVQPEGRPMIQVHNGTYPLENRGIISLGETIYPDNPDLVYYEIV
ncbi:MAG TPA: FHA domain-containing protein [Gammaproteobacteria bacterium]|nr:FHA domain-containing protein [Gammaproteobacteria bacterium]